MERSSERSLNTLRVFVGALALPLCASQLEVFSAYFSATAYTKTDAPLSTTSDWYVAALHAGSPGWTLPIHTNVRQTILYISMEIKTFSQLSAKKPTHFCYA
jgi:hypothetical protein